jgi:hydroxyethylthiazole kinase-like uncharacterized protein yjeF
MLTIGPGAALLTPDAMRAAEAAAIAAGTPALRLMERAAAAAALAIDRFAPARPALVLCGPGNNGGDGYAVAALLRVRGRAVRVAACGPARGEPAVTMATRWAGPVETLEQAEPASLIIDALFGTGLQRQLAAPVQAALDRLRDCGATIIALDTPSGIDALTGDCLGRPLAADMTICFGAMKRGQALGAGRSLSGRIVVADIGVPLPMDGARLVPPPRREPLPADTHKYRRGALLVIEAAPERGGAAQLTALAALRAGAGVVTLVGAGHAQPGAAIMRRSDMQGVAMLADLRLGAVAIGPGLVADQRGRDWVHRLLGGDVPLVIDAGALSALPSTGFAEARAPRVLTPHDGEFTRLFGAIGADRVAATTAAAKTSDSVIVLKGAETIIAVPDGRVGINLHATPWLATAGSGDVLTGIIAALLAQGLAPFDAARAGVWLHGDAGIRCGPGLIADDLPGLLPSVLAAL